MMMEDRAAAAAGGRPSTPDAPHVTSTSPLPRKKRNRKKKVGDAVAAEIDVVAVDLAATSLEPACSADDATESNESPAEESATAEPEAAQPPEPPAAAGTAAAVAPTKVISVSDFCVACRELEFAGPAADARTRIRPRGFVNTGNACYRNAVLQALLAAAPLGRLLAALADRADRMPSTMPVWRELLSLAAALVAEAPPPVPAKPTTAAVPPPPSLTPDAYLSQAVAAFQRKMAATRGQPAPAAYMPGAASNQPPPGAQGAGTVVGPGGGSGSKVNGGGLTVARRLAPQEDAMEFMTFLLETLDEEMAGGDRAFQEQAAMKEAEHAGWETKTHAKVKAVVDDASRLDSARANAATTVTRLFYGTLRSEVAYAANRSATRKLNSTTFQRFSSLMLDIREPQQQQPRADAGHSQSGGGGSGSGGGGWSVASGNRKHGGALPHAPTCGPPLRLDEVLERHFQAEQVDSGATVKRVQLDHLPQVLVMPLNRFDYDRARNTPKKIDREIRYPLTLVVQSAWLSTDLKDRLAKQTSGDTAESLSYGLVAVVRHHGASANAGHYTALCKDAAADPARWGWEFDDAKGTPITSDDALAATQTAYILVYTRQGGTVV